MAVDIIKLQRDLCLILAIKIWTNLNLNFPPHLTSAVDRWVRESHMFVINVHNFKIFEQIRSNAEYKSGNNRRPSWWAFADRNYSSGIQDQSYMILRLNIWLKRPKKKFCQPEEEPFERKVDKNSSNRKESRAYFLGT